MNSAKKVVWHTKEDGGAWMEVVVKVETEQTASSLLAAACPGIWERATNPANQMKNMVIRSIIMALNDEHGWSRNAIADWLESLDVDLTLS